VYFDSELRNRTSPSHNPLSPSYGKADKLARGK
jgi:hypothetical protein